MEGAARLAAGAVRGLVAELGQQIEGKALLTDSPASPSRKKGIDSVCVTHCPSVLQDGNVRLYSILGTTLKDEGKLLEAKGPVTDVAYSHDGAFLAVCDASKVVTVFSVADGYSVSGRTALCPHAGQCRWRAGAKVSLLSSPTRWIQMRPHGFITLRA